MFNLEIKRGRGQQRQYREEDMSVLERIKDLVEQGWPTSQIRPQLEAEGLLTPRLIGVPPTPGNPEVLQEAIIGLRNFSERRFIDISRQIDELRQLIIKTTVSQELSADRSSPWQPMASEFVPKAADVPEQEITIGPQISLDPPKAPSAPPIPPQRTSQIPPSPVASPVASPAASPMANPVTSPVTSPTSYSGANSSISPASAQPAATNFAPTDSRPITDALQRSMSTLDSLWKDPRSTGTASSTSHPSIVSGFDEDEDEDKVENQPAAQSAPAVRHSTIPPTPQVSEQVAQVVTPATAPATTQITSPTNNPLSSPTSYLSNAASNPANTQASAAAPSPQISAPTALSGSLAPSQAISQTASSQPASNPSADPTSSPASAASPEPAKASAWDQAFASTSVDVNALPKSGLFEDKPVGTASSTNSGINPASLEHNPFTTITGTNYSAVSRFTYAYIFVACRQSPIRHCSGKPLPAARASAPAVCSDAPQSDRSFADRAKQPGLSIRTANLNWSRLNPTRPPATCPKHRYHRTRLPQLALTFLSL